LLVFLVPGASATYEPPGQEEVTTHHIFEVRPVPDSMSEPVSRICLAAGNGNPYGFSGTLFQEERPALGFSGDQTAFWNALHKCSIEGGTLPIGKVAVFLGQRSEPLEMEAVLLTVCQGFQGTSVSFGGAPRYAQSYTLLPFPSLPWHVHGKKIYVCPQEDPKLESLAYPALPDGAGTKNCSAYQKCSKDPVLTWGPGGSKCPVS
jgi:hypothetical protein